MGSGSPRDRISSLWIHSTPYTKFCTLCVRCWDAMRSKKWSLHSEISRGEADIYPNNYTPKRQACNRVPPTWHCWHFGPEILSLCWCGGGSCVLQVVKLHPWSLPVAPLSLLITRNVSRHYQISPLPRLPSQCWEASIKSRGKASWEEHLTHIWTESY